MRIQGFHEQADLNAWMKLRREIQSDHLNHRSDPTVIDEALNEPMLLAPESTQFLDGDSIDAQHLTFVKTCSMVNDQPWALKQAITRSSSFYG